MGQIQGIAICPILICQWFTIECSKIFFKCQTSYSQNEMDSVKSLILLCSCQCVFRKSNNFHEPFLNKHRCRWRMLETKFNGDINIGDGSGHFSYQHPISFYKSVKLQDSKMSPITKISQQYWNSVINITATIHETDNLQWYWWLHGDDSFKTLSSLSVTKISVLSTNFVMVDLENFDSFLSRNDRLFLEIILAYNCQW